MLNLFASLAEFERELIRERTLAGLAAARAWGRVGGRKPGLSEAAQRTARAAELLYKARALSVDDMARSLRICKATFYKYLHHRGVALHAQPLPSPVAGAVSWVPCAPGGAQGARCRWAAPCGDYTRYSPHFLRRIAILALALARRNVLSNNLLG